MDRNSARPFDPRPLGWPPQTFLGMLSESTREELLSLGISRECLPEDVLILEGDKSTDVMTLIDGWVKVLGATEEGGQALLSLRVGGDLVGEQAALDNAPRSATVISAGVTVVRVMAQREFLRFLDRQAGRQRRRQPFALERATLGYPAQDRLQRAPGHGPPGPGAERTRYLYGKPTPNGIEFQYTLTQPELAAMVGASEPAVHKALRQLRSDKIVTTGYRQVVITDPAALVAIASSRSGSGSAARKPVK